MFDVTDNASETTCFPLRVRQSIESQGLGQRGVPQVPGLVVTAYDGCRMRLPTFIHLLASVCDAIRCSIDFYAYEVVRGLLPRLYGRAIRMVDMNFGEYSFHALR
jgi:hypothetical protein